MKRTIIILAIALITLCQSSATSLYHFTMEKEPTMQSSFTMPNSMHLKSYRKNQSNKRSIDANGYSSSGASLVSSSLSITGRDFYDSREYHWYLYDNLWKGNINSGRIVKDNYNPYVGYNGMLSAKMVTIKAPTKESISGGTFDPHEFGEAPDFDADAPIGDSIVPMILLLSLLITVKKVRRR